jgi:hypothetical protein
MFLETVKGFPPCAALHDPVLRRQSRYPHPEPRNTLLISRRNAPVPSKERSRIPVHRPCCHQAQHPAPAKSPQPSPQPWPQPAYCTLSLPVIPPQHTVAYSASSSTSPSPDPSQAEIIRLHGIIADMVGSPSRDAHLGMPVPPTEYPNATLFSESRPRANYCWLHGWNNTHPGTTCKVMGQNPAYTHAMKHATGPNGTGGNPRVGVPVSFSRPPLFFSPLRFVCPPCL